MSEPELRPSSPGHPAKRAGQLPNARRPRHAMTDSLLAADRIDRAEAADPTERIEAMDPMLPAENADPTLPTDKMESFEAMDSTLPEDFRLQRLARADIG